jgi:sugar O-acyltransferase (sialic acid O-acetyltransferase NeuD family)
LVPCSFSLPRLASFRRCMGINSLSTMPDQSPILQTSSSPASSAILLGGGGHAVVVAEAWQRSKGLIAGFLDDHAAAPLAAIVLPQVSAGATESPLTPSPTWLGPLSLLQSPDTAKQVLAGHPWIIALGDLRTRRGLLKLLSQLTAANHLGPAATAIHPCACLSPTATIAPGTYLGPMAIVHSRAVVSPHAIINSGAIVEHDCHIGENSHIAPGAVLGGSVRIGHDTLVGLGSRVLPGVKIGDACTIGAGAVVISDVPDGKTVVGVPARWK